MVNALSRNMEKFQCKNYIISTGENSSVRIGIPSGMRTDDIPILTDEFSPVEIMINPVTSQPYFNEDSVFSQDSSRIWFSESTSVIIGLLGLS